MHAGFARLNTCPMNLRRPRKPVPMSDQVNADIAAIQTLWRECRKSFGEGGPFLFGAFTGADAMFAPVVTRFDTYDIAVDTGTQDYMSAVMNLPAFQQWRAAALKETWTIAADEVD
jgi:glutathione S-transferase